MNWKRQIASLFLVGIVWASQTAHAETYVERPTGVNTEMMGIAEVTTDNLNVRMADDFNSSVVQVIPKGTKRTVWSSSNGLYQVGLNQWITANGNYISYQAYTPVTSSAPDVKAAVTKPSDVAEEAIGIVEVTANEAYLRTQSNKSAPVRSILPKGSKWIAVASENGMYKIEENGWVNSGSEWVGFTPYVGATGIVNGSVTLLQTVNLREEPSWSAPVMRVLPKDSIWNVVGKQGDWYDTGGGNWLPAGSSYVNFGPPVVPDDPEVTVSASVTLLQTVNLRDEPAWNGAVLRVLEKGGVWNVVGKKGDWYNTGGGNWIPAGSSYVKLGPVVVPEDPDEVISKSVTLLQTLYLRNVPNASGKVIRVLPKGSVWNVVARKGDWYDTGGGNWLQGGSSNVKLGSTIIAEDPDETVSKSVNLLQTLYLRDVPDESGKVLRVLPKGSVWNVVARKGDWYDTGGGNWLYGGSGNVTFGPTITHGSLSGKKIVIDPGHGGDDPGAIALDGTSEQLINLQFSLKIRDALRAKGAQVVMIRESDRSCNNMPKSTLELQCRVDKVAENGANLFISIHANSYYVTSAKGVETFYSTSNANPSGSKRLAELVHGRIKTTIGTTDRGVKPYDYYILRKNTVPAILIETGFLTNSGDLAKLKSAAVQTGVANDITAAVQAYYN